MENATGTEEGLVKTKLRNMINQCLAKYSNDVTLHLCSSVVTWIVQVSARATAQEVGIAYLDLDDAGRLDFFQILAEDYNADHDKLQVRLAHCGFITSLRP